MAVLVGLGCGFLVGVRWPTIRFTIAVLLPLLVAALEIVVNTVRFGATSMVLWAPVLVVLTVGATALSREAGRRVQAVRARPAKELH